MRVDKWLWVARLMKTRSAAAEAVGGGKVHVNGRAVKPSREVAPGDELEITREAVRQTVVVKGLAPRRGPAAEAALLYEETPESVRARERHAEQRRLAAQTQPDFGGRPTKRDRRRFDRSRGR
ncbi:MAG TPA: S4 domain-containing protein [Solirubrobacteraceae bacterium]|nr:S4 domain-containing protein [Solirubrobacteraceae bacterium]